MNKIILYTATSLDGFIVDIQDGVELEAAGYKKLMSRQEYGLG